MEAFSLHPPSPPCLPLLSNSEPKRLRHALINVGQDASHGVRKEWNQNAFFNSLDYHAIQNRKSISISLNTFAIILIEGYSIRIVVIIVICYAKRHHTPVFHQDRSVSDSLLVNTHRRI